MTNPTTLSHRIETAEAESREPGRDVPFSQLSDAQIAAMPQRERNWYSDWAREARIDAERRAAVAEKVRTADVVHPCCRNCDDWRNHGSAWGGCWSRDSMGDDEIENGPRRVTLAGDRCEAWLNPLVVFDGNGWSGINSSLRARASQE